MTHLQQPEAALVARVVLHIGPGWISGMLLDLLTPPGTRAATCSAETAAAQVDPVSTRTQASTVRASVGSSLTPIALRACPAVLVAHSRGRVSP